MRKAVGIMLLIIAFAILFAVTCVSAGIKIALIAWGISILITAIVILAICLIG